MSRYLTQPLCKALPEASARRLPPILSIPRGATLRRQGTPHLADDFPGAARVARQEQQILRPARLRRRRCALGIGPPESTGTAQECQVACSADLVDRPREGQNPRARSV